MRERDRARASESERGVGGRATKYDKSTRQYVNAYM